MKEAQKDKPIISDEIRFLSQYKVPGRIDSRRAAALLGFSEHDVPILLAARLLVPLGKPAQNSPKWFATNQILELSRDRDWLDRATTTIQKYWQTENSKKPKKCSVNCSVPVMKSVETVATE